MSEFGSSPDEARDDLRLEFVRQHFRDDPERVVAHLRALFACNEEEAVAMRRRIDAKMMGSLR